tara:strand:- start:3465 stop:3602 length:138 start_codon:yes stop_codon:yes gene_type:complete
MLNKKVIKKYIIVGFKKFSFKYKYKIPKINKIIKEEILIISTDHK